MQYFLLLDFRIRVDIQAISTLQFCMIILFNKNIWVLLCHEKLILKDMQLDFIFFCVDFLF